MEGRHNNGTEKEREKEEGRKEGDTRKPEEDISCSCNKKRKQEKG